MRNSTMEYKVNQAYEELKRLIQWNPDSEEKFLQKMVCLLLPGQRKCWSEAIRDLRQSFEAEQGMIFVEKYRGKLEWLNSISLAELQRKIGEIYFVDHYKMIADQFLYKKDFETSLFLRITLLIPVVFAIINRSLMTSVSFATCFIAMASGYTFSISEKNGMERLYGILPITKKEFVLGRYLYTIIMGGIAVLFSCIVHPIVLFILGDKVTWQQIIFTFLYGILLYSIYTVFQLPGYYKYGSINGRMFMYIPIIGFLLVLFGMEKVNLSKNGFAISIFSNLGILAAVITFGIILIYTVSICISIRIMKNKEI